MKYKFSFIQVTNWLMICRDNLKKIRSEANDGFEDKEKIIEKLINLLIFLAEGLAISASFII